MKWGSLTWPEAHYTNCFDLIFYKGVLLTLILIKLKKISSVIQFQVIRIMIKYCTCHDSRAVMACANFVVMVSLQFRYKHSNNCVEYQYELQMKITGEMGQRFVVFLFYVPPLHAMSPTTSPCFYAGLSGHWNGQWSWGLHINQATNISWQWPWQEMRKHGKWTSADILATNGAMQLAALTVKLDFFWPPIVQLLKILNTYLLISIF